MSTTTSRETQRNRVTLTYALAMATSQDAGNAHMRKHGRSAWNLADYNVACAKLEKLTPHLVTKASQP